MRKRRRSRWYHPRARPLSGPSGDTFQKFKGKFPHRSISMRIGQFATSGDDIVSARYLPLAYILASPTSSTALYISYKYRLWRNKKVLDALYQRISEVPAHLVVTDIVMDVDTNTLSPLDSRGPPRRALFGVLSLCLAPLAAAAPRPLVSSRRSTRLWKSQTSRPVRR